MAEPQTVNGGLIVPNTGDLVGTWGSAALNPDFVAVDGFLCWRSDDQRIVNACNSNVSRWIYPDARRWPDAGAECCYQIYRSIDRQRCWLRSRFLG